MNSRRQFIHNSLALFLGSTTPAFALQQPQMQTTNKVGVVLDPLFLKHDLKGHPENANRLRAIDKELSNRDYWKYFSAIKSRFATDEELSWVHQSGYLFEIENLSESGGGYFDPNSQDTYLNEFSFDAAKMAAGGNIELNLAVYDRKVDYGFGLLRPPGHHARQDQAMGFCLLNSDVLAAKALQKYRGVKRVAILDFDVHHGNGTQDLTIDDPSIMALSIHQHPFWPMTGFDSMTGEGAAKGTNVNLSFRQGAGDQTYLESFDKVIAPKLREFKPEHIIVFAGYDGHWQDPLAGHQVTVNGYNQYVKRCIAIADELCGGRLSFSLGGGYKLNPLAQCVAGSLHTMLGLAEDFEDVIGSDKKVETDYSKEIDELVKLHLTAQA